MAIGYFYHEKAYCFEFANGAAHSMTGTQPQSLQRLKQHFAQRVIHQARQLLELWQNLQSTEWSGQNQVNMDEAAQRLLRYAERFEQPEHVHIAQQLLATLAAIQSNANRLNSEFIEAITQLLQQLLQTGLRQGEGIDQVCLPAMVRKPIYIALACTTQAQNLAQQLQSFYFQVEVFTDDHEFLLAMDKRHPAVIILDVDFVEHLHGLELARQLKDEHDSKIPILFYSQTEVDAQTRLAAVRAGGQAFSIDALDASSVLEKIEGWISIAQPEPYKALVIDDSRAQATFTERALNAAGIITRAINDPTQALTQLLDFDPDLIILDMYMPQCEGP